jgi:phosphoglucomutase
MERMRNTPETQLGGEEVLAVRDYQTGIRTDLKTKKTSLAGLPKSNVLYDEIANGAWCCVRPSGTEPKIKFYYGVRGSSHQDADQKLELLKNDLLAMAEH